MTAEHPRGVGPDVAGRCEALARLGLGDGRPHVIQERDVAIAVGEGDVGLGMIFPEGPMSAEAVERALLDLRRVAAGMDDRQTAERRRVPRARASEVRHANPESAALALCAAVEEATRRPVAVVTRDPVTQVARILAVSSQADARLARTSIAPDSIAARALSSDQPIAARGATELFGHYLQDRRRQDDEGIVFPMRDGDSTVGALVLFGSVRRLDENVRHQAQRLATEAAPGMGRLLAVEAAERLARTDALTGLANRRGYDEALQRYRASGTGAVGLACVDLDRFKSLNDQHGHEAGDAALRHVARLFIETLRTGDRAIRMGGEEFALWLPGASLGAATEIAERVRAVIERTPCFWDGTRLPITCSVGVAAVPEVVQDVDNLYGAADAALYRAKQRGRNRVEVARPADADVMAGTGGNRRE